MNIKKTVIATTENNLCISCGACSAVCNFDAINMNYSKGLIVPQVNHEKCCECGKCLKVCPGKGINYKEMYSLINRKLPEDFYIGNDKFSSNVQSNDDSVLKNSTSGGFVTSIVRSLLKDEFFDIAFLVDTFNYADTVKTVGYNKDNDFNITSKSRYIPVVQTDAFLHIIKNPESKVIFVGTSCFVHALHKVIKMYKLDLNNYLIIGLFCDKTLNYNIFDYFKEFEKNKSLNELYFRTKETSAWPGDVRLVFNDNTYKDLPAKSRMRVKSYFQPERCHYCLDKLNQFADISVGDNYTGKNSDDKGSNSVIIRTKQGEEFFNKCKNLFNVNSCKLNEIAVSQKINLRKRNLKFAKLKNIEGLLDGFNLENVEITANDKKTYKYYMDILKLGENKKYDEINKMCRASESTGFRKIYLKVLKKLKSLVAIN